jgi:hypothetical protein
MARLAESGPRQSQSSSYRPSYPPVEIMIAEMEAMIKAHEAPRRKAAVKRVIVRAVLGLLLGLMLAGLLWASSRGLHWAFAWNLGRTVTTSLGWWISWPAGVMVCAVGIGVWRKK